MTKAELENISKVIDRLKAELKEIQRINKERKERGNSSSKIQTENME